MKRIPQLPGIAWTVAGVLVALALLAGSLFAGPFGIEALLVYYSWILFMFLHYRYLRQNELVYMLAGAAEAQQPLPSVLWAYLLDRPRGSVRSVMEAIVLSAVFPGYWFYHRLHSFDRKVYRLACLLESGEPLSRALQRTRGVASRETALAASVGETTGKLALTLRKVPEWRVSTIWLDLLPRLLYPLCLLLTSIGVISFFIIFIAPKFEKIFKDFGIQLPVVTQLMLDLSRSVARNFPLFVLIMLCLGGLLALLIFNATACWYCPVLKRFYRMIVQSRVLKMLGLLLQTGQPVPQALGVLIDSGYFRGVVRRKLEKVRNQVAQGADLADELHGAGLIPDSMIPLVRSSAKANNLPWALEELGEHRAKQSVGAAHRFSVTLFPISIMFAALIVGFMVLSTFSPLLTMLDDLPQRIRR